jgi:hypothetical protein
MIYWNFIVAGLCLLLLIFLVWKEFQRANKAWIVGRLVASVLAVAALACMVFPIMMHKQQTMEGSGEIVIAAPGFNKDSLARFVEAKSKTVPVYHLDEVATEGTGAKSITEIEAALESNVNVVHVFGEGLDHEELKLLEDIPVVFHPADLTSGLTAISWQNKLKAGERLNVQGSFTNVSGNPLKVILEAFDTNLDSLTFPAGASKTFELSTVPKHSGLAIYSIIALEGKDTLLNEPVPIEVKPTVPLKFLLLAASPDFENKFLKDWLAQNSYAVAVRTAISKNKYSKEFLNIPSFSVDRVTSNVLDKFDAVIADASELAALSKQEQGMLQNYVDQKGLGLFIETDSSLGNSFYGRLFAVVQSTNINEQTVRLHLADSASHLPELSIEQPLYIRPQPATQALVSDQQLRPLVSNTIYGSGRLVLSTLSNTYQWVLSGKKEAYTQFWSTILTKAAKNTPAKEAWIVGASMPRINQPVQLNLETQSTEVPRGQVGEDFFYLQQNSRLPYRWSGTYWPVSTGWQAGIQMNGNTYWWYAYSHQDYKSIRAIERKNNTQQYALKHPYVPHKTAVASKTIKVNFPKFGFFILFLICCGFLWVERKFL